MTRRASGFSAANPLLAWMTICFKASEMMLASAQVIHHRSNRMASAGLFPNARDQREFTLMGQEKIEAFTESSQAAMGRLLLIPAQIGSLAFKQMTEGISGMMAMNAAPAFTLSTKRQNRLMQDAINRYTAAATQISGSAARIAHHALHPIHSRATGNAKRLAKVK